MASFDFWEGENQLNQTGAEELRFCLNSCWDQQCYPAIKVFVMFDPLICDDLVEQEELRDEGDEHRSLGRQGERTELERGTAFFTFHIILILKLLLILQLVSVFCRESRLLFYTGFNVCTAKEKDLNLTAG